MVNHPTSTGPGVRAAPAGEVTHEAVLAAAAALRGHVIHTPTARSRTLSQITGADVWVKFENLQFTASYKERGARNRLRTLAPGSEVVTASAGNFAQGVAHHAALLGLRAVLVMPTTTPVGKVARTAHLGAEIVLHGSDFDQAERHAAELAAQLGAELLSPFDDPDVIVGQGTVALELLADAPDVEVLIAPVGGGGLLAGMAVTARALRPEIELVGVQSERYPAVHEAFARRAGREPATPTGTGPTIAEGIAVDRPGRRTSVLLESLVDRVELVSEEQLEEAVGLYLEVEKTVAEGAGAAPLAELLARPDRYRGRAVGLVLSGGNIDLRQLASVTLRSLVRSGRLSTIWVRLDDRPGSLGTITSEVGRLGANIVEVAHRRLDPGVHTRATDVELTIETMDRSHFVRVVDSLVEAGHHVRTAPTVPTI